MHRFRLMLLTSLMMVALLGSSLPGSARELPLRDQWDALTLSGGGLAEGRISYRVTKDQPLTITFPQGIPLPEDAHRLEWKAFAPTALRLTPHFVVQDAAGTESVFPGYRFGGGGWQRFVSTSLLPSGNMDRQVPEAVLSRIRPQFLKTPLRLVRVVLTSSGEASGEFLPGPLSVSTGTPRDSACSWRFWGTHAAGYDEAPSFPCDAILDSPGAYEVTVVARQGWQGPVAHWAAHALTLTADPRTRLQRIPVPVSRRGTYYITVTARRRGEAVPLARKDLTLAVLNGDDRPAVSGARPGWALVVPEAITASGDTRGLRVRLYPPPSATPALTWRYTVRPCGYWQHSEDQQMVPPRLGEPIAEGGGPLADLSPAGAVREATFRPPHTGQAYAVNARILSGEKVLDEATWLVGAPEPKRAPVWSKDLLPARDFMAGNIFTCGTNEPYTPDQAEMWREWLSRTASYQQPVVEIMIYWANLEPTPGVYRFDWLDRQIADAKAAGRKVLVRFSIEMLPVWLPREPMANQHGESEILHWEWYHNLPSPFGPEFRAAYPRALQRLAEHYASEPAVVAWQVWGLRWDNFYQDYTDFRDEIDRIWTDYSPYARDAFSRYLRESRRLSLPEINRRYGASYRSPEEIRMPLPTYDRNRAIEGYGIDASPEWRDLTAFKKDGYRHWVIDMNVGAVRRVGDPRAFLVNYGGGLGALPELFPELKRLGGMMSNGGSDTHTHPQVSSQFLLAGVPMRSESVWFQPIAELHMDQPIFDALFYGGEGAHYHTMWMVGRTRPGFEPGMARLQRWQDVMRRLRRATPVATDIAVVWNMDSALLGGSKTFYHGSGGYWENLALQWFQHYAAIFPCDAILPEDLSRYKMVVASAPVLRAETLRRLNEYVRAGGTLILYGDSGERTVESPDAATHPLANSLGLPVAPVQVGEVAARPTPEAPFRVGRVTFQSRVSAPARAGEDVWATFPDGAPAIVRVPLGRGAVVRFLGSPKFMPDLSSWSQVYAGIAERAGARRAAQVSQSQAYAWHHADGDTHYVGVIRDRTWHGSDWAKFVREGRVPVKTRVFLLPEGRYQVEELTYGESLGTFTAAQLAEGIPVPLYRAEAKVLCLKPVK